MKKTIKINLSGMAFTLDEDAYQLLKSYLDQISSYFKDPAWILQSVNLIKDNFMSGPGTFIECFWIFQFSVYGWKVAIKIGSFTQHF